MIVHTHKLNMVPDGRIEIIRLNQWDEDVVLVFNLFASEGTFSFDSGTTVTCIGRRKDGYPIEIPAEFTDDNQVTVEVSAEMADVHGTGWFELEFECDDKLLHSQNFRVHFYRSAYQGGGDG